MFADPAVDALWCVRGGYGASRLLPLLDWDLIRANPKALVGYSDITALHMALHTQAGLVSFHGPIAARGFTPYSLAELRQVLWSAGRARSTGRTPARGAARGPAGVGEPRDHARCRAGHRAGSSAAISA